MVEKKDNRLVKYFVGVKSEFKKISWGTFAQLMKNTSIVILAIFICGIIIWGLDSVFGLGLNNLLLKK